MFLEEARLLRALRVFKVLVHLARGLAAGMNTKRAKQQGRLGFEVPCLSKKIKNFDNRDGC